jgi:hypothetical protein
MTTIHSLQRRIRRLKPPTLGRSSAHFRAVPEWRFTMVFVSIHTHTHKDFGRAQHEMSSSGHADKCLWFIGAFEQLLRQIYRGDAILVSVNDQNRDMNVTNREVRRNWSNISQRTGSIL